MRILFNSRDPEYKSPFGVLTENQPCKLHIKTPRDIEARSVQLVIDRDEGGPALEFPFVWTEREGDYDRFRCEFSVPDNGLYFYWFRITAKSGTFRLFKAGSETNMEAGDRWQLSVIPADFTVPADFQGRVMYQIFPDRFAREGDCDLTDKLRPFILREDWGGVPEYRPDPVTGGILCNDFFGGNFRGIESRLEYLQSLGVGLLYLNPISMAFSNHRYDTADYKRPDPMLGTEEDFRSLCAAAHRLGMKVILDGVYNHTGADSVYFDRQGRFGNGAVSKGEASPYYGWYSFRSFPDRYDCWWDFATLPNVNELDEGFLNYIIQDEDSVIAHWLRLGADGFRLDVADELPDEFIRRFKARLRQLNPQALLMGEVWEDASNKIAYSLRRRYFTDGELDSVMNYPWRTAILNFLREQDDGTALGEAIMAVAENYPPQVLQALMNALGTHDTPRILTALMGDFPGDREYQAKVRLSFAQRELAFQRLRLAAFLQYTLPGCPCLYYGDEAGMEGCKDPFNRGCYPWGREDRRFTDFFRDLGRLKNNSAALRSGTVRVVKAGEGKIAFLRQTGTQTVLCCVNRSGEPLRVEARQSLLSQNGTRQAEGFVVNPDGFGCFEL
jgi:glycosidase